MRYRLLGRSGLRVSELSLGAMTFGEDWGWGAAKEECRRMLELYVEAGGNFIDTANNYTNGTSESFVGELCAAERDRYVIATKYTLSNRPGDPNAGGNGRKNLVQSVEGSLRRLRTDRIDLLWLHAWDYLTPVDEVMRSLDDLVRAGKVLYLGISDTPAWIVARANTLAELRGWTRFSALQIQYSLVDRTPERELLPMAEALELTVTPWGALAGGVLSGKYNTARPKPGEARLADGPMSAAYVNERNLAIAAAVGEVARQVDRSPSQVALAWVRQQLGGTMVPILGARTLAQLKDNLGSLELTLPEDALARLDAASRIELGFPHDFLRSPFVLGLIHGGTRERIIAPPPRG